MTDFTRRALLGASALAVPGLARAQPAWPSGPIRIVVPFPAGGSVDAIARLVQPELQRRLGATVLIENRGGASGSIGAALAAKAAPDGNTWLFVFDTHAVNPSLLQNLAFDSEKDLDPVLLIGTAPNLLATHPSRPFRTLADVIEAAKGRPEALTYATIGAGSLGHLTMVLLSKRAGVSLAHVPYRGGGPAVNDAVGGHVDLVIGSAALLANQVAGGALRPVVQTGDARHPALAAVPTVAESGFPGFTSRAWWGVFAPAGTPARIQQRFRGELEAALRQPEIASRLVEGQTMELSLGGPDALGAFFKEQMTTWGAVVRENGIKGDS
jgi:tripartite-type tricarboxylate transporter receptor subunit TctC